MQRITTESRLIIRFLLFYFMRGSWICSIYYSFVLLCFSMFRKNCSTDMEQRRGRMVRQGNENDEVRLFRYVTEGTFDSYLYQIRFFNQEQIQIIEEEAVKCYKNGKRIYRIGEIIIFLLNVGLRIGEALALEWSDIDFDKKYVKIRKNVVFVKVRDESNSSYNYHIVEQNAPKTKSGNRIVPLNSAALKALKSLYAINGKHKYVFSTSNGNRVYPRNVDRMFRSVLKKCCIKPTGVHTLRHQYVKYTTKKFSDFFEKFCRFSVSNPYIPHLQ